MYRKVNKDQSMLTDIALSIRKGISCKQTNAELACSKDEVREPVWLINEKWGRAHSTNSRSLTVKTINFKRNEYCRTRVYQYFPTDQAGMHHARH